MKLKAIEKLCMDRKVVLIIDDGANQWLSDGAGMYLMADMPELTAENVLVLFDIDAKKAKKIHCKIMAFPEELNREDIILEESMAELGSVAVWADGTVMQPIYTDSGVVFINRSELLPFRDLEDGYSLYARRSTLGNIYIAVKHGMELIGILLPFYSLSASKVAELEKLLNGCRAAQEIRQAEDAQVSFEEG